MINNLTKNIKSYISKAILQQFCRFFSSYYNAISNISYMFSL